MRGTRVDTCRQDKGPGRLLQGKSVGTEPWRLCASEGGRARGPGMQKPWGRDGQSTARWGSESDGRELGRTAPRPSLIGSLLTPFFTLAEANKVPKPALPHPNVGRGLEIWPVQLVSCSESLPWREMGLPGQPQFPCCGTSS